MQILSDYKQDTRSEKNPPGAYEWWYFDGTDPQGVYSFAIIFYEGNPFSTRYIKKQKNGSGGEPARADDYPAVSISIYENGKPIYYSFTEFSSDQGSFETDYPGLQIGDHVVEMEVVKERLVYRLNLKEKLVSGDGLEGTVVFESPAQASLDLNERQGGGHRWNLVQPRAGVTADLTLLSAVGPDRRIFFTGTGYHDHNTGLEPMKNEFVEWNWGRFHFRSGTLVYYIMDRKSGTRHEAWLIAPDNGEVLLQFPEVGLEDRGWTRFGMRSPRRIMLGGTEADVTIQHPVILDDGPFYQRFGSDAFLNIKGKKRIESASGIAEYIRPERIHWRLFWPLTEMRIRYKTEPPHWVQRFPRLYRLTW